MGAIKFFGRIVREHNAIETIKSCCLGHNVHIGIYYQRKKVTKLYKLIYVLKKTIHPSGFDWLLKNVLQLYFIVIIIILLQYT